jgi:hypothetical protein
LFLNKRGFIDGEYQDGELRGCVFLAGKRGMGKTTQMDRLLSGCSGGVLFFDSLSKHAGVLKGYHVISEPGPLRDYLLLYRGRPCRVLYQPRAGSLDAHFQAVCLIVRAVGWLILAIDELDKLCGPRWGDSRMCPELYHLVNYGRHDRVSLVATARRPTSVARGYTSECLAMHLFRITEKADLKYFEDYIGAANAARLPGLAPYQFLAWQEMGEAELKGGRR